MSSARNYCSARLYEIFERLDQAYETENDFTAVRLVASDLRAAARIIETQPRPEGKRLQ
jgi:hypothetical protein